MNEISRRLMDKTKGACLFGLAIITFLCIIIYLTTSRTTVFICCTCIFIILICVLINYNTYRKLKKIDRMEIIGRR